MLTENKPLFARKIQSLSNFDSYGLETLAYIKTVTVDGNLCHSIHAADGTPLKIIAERDAAFALVRQNEMEPTSVH